MNFQDKKSQGLNFEKAFAPAFKAKNSAKAAAAVKPAAAVKHAAAAVKPAAVKLAAVGKPAAAVGKPAAAAAKPSAARKPADFSEDEETELINCAIEYSPSKQNTVTRKFSDHCILFLPLIW